VTMRFVIDTNQASLLPSGEKRALAVSLSPYVLSEILLRGDPSPTLELLRTFDIRLGLETSDVMSKLAQLSPQEITTFEPFPVPAQSFWQDYEAIRKAIDAPRPAHIRRARYIKESHLRHCKSLVGTARIFRRHLRERGMANHKFSTFEQALSELASTPDSFLRSVIVGSITNDGKRTTKGPPAELLDAVLANQYVGRLFRAQLAYHICISRLWTEESLNFDPSPTRDDMTDITLPLYAADGDVIVTGDTKLTLLVSLIDPGGRIGTCKASQIV